MTDSQAFQEQHPRLPDPLLVVLYTGKLSSAHSCRRTEQRIIDQPSYQPRLYRPVTVKPQLSDSSVS